MLILSQKAEGVPVSATLASTAWAGLRELSLWGCGLFGGAGRMGSGGRPPGATWGHQHTWLQGPSSIKECFSREYFFHLMYPHIKISKIITLLKNQASDSDF